jgi:hypothetical protein
MGDPVLDTFFKDEPDRYPGSRVPVEEGRKKRQAKAAARAEEEPEEPTWIDNPYFRREMSVDGAVVVFYTLAAMAEALNRKPVTIRAWESQGKFPQPPFKTKANGAKGGKRLYTQAMIEGTRAIADEEGLLYSQRPLTPRFTQRVTILFNQQRQEMRKSN